MERAVRDIAGATREVAHRVGASSEAIPMVAELAREVSSTLERFRVEIESVRGEMSRRLPAAVEERLSRVTSEFGDMITTSLRSTTEAAGERTSGALDGLRAAVSGLEERVSGAVSGGHEATQVRLTAALDALTTQLRTVEDRLQERLAEAVSRAVDASDQRLTTALETLTRGAEVAQERLRETFAPLRGLPSQLSEAMDALGQAIAEMAAAQTAVEERLDTVRDTTVTRANDIESGLADALTAVGTSVREDQERATERFSEVLTNRIDELRTVVGSLLGTGLEALDERVRGLGTRVDQIARQTEEASARVDEAARRAAQGVAAGATEGARRSAEQVGRRVEEAVERVADRVDDAAQGIADRSDRLAELLEATFTAVEARIAQATAPLSRTIDASVGSVREAVSNLDVSLQNVVRRVGSTIGDLRGEFAGLDQTVGGLGGEMEALRGAVDTFRLDAGNLGEALGEVTRMRDALDSLGKRRGLRELAEADRLVAEQQTAFVEQLTGAGEQLASRLSSLEEQLRAAVDSGELSRLQTEVTERIGTELANLRTSVAEEVERRIAEAVSGVLEGVRAQIADAIPTTVTEAVRKEAAEALPGKALTKDVREIAKMQRENEKVVSTLKTDLGDIKRRVASWGRARGAPKLAEELVAVEERIGEVEALVQEDLVEAVFERMQRAFDRRFDALVQLIDMRLQQQPSEPSLVDQRRGIFRRSRE